MEYHRKYIIFYDFAFKIRNNLISSLLLLQLYHLRNLDFPCSQCHNELKLRKLLFYISISQTIHNPNSLSRN